MQLDTQRGDLESSGPHADEAPGRTAWHARLLGVAFSGGGIRSATLNLGVLQASRALRLAALRRLSLHGIGRRLHRLVAHGAERSGASRAIPTDAQRAGVDTGSLLSFNRQGFKSFERGLAWSAGDSGRDGPEREDRAIRFLREFSNYLDAEARACSRATRGR